MINVNDQLASIERQFFDLGLEFPAPLEFGKVVRVKSVDDKGSKKSGWYVCHEFRLNSGAVAITGKIGNWKHGDNGVNIEVDWKGLTDDERAKLKEQTEQQKAQAEAEKIKLQAATKKRAQAVWNKLPDFGKSDYLTRKKVMGYGLRFSRGSVAVPMYDIAGDINNLQWIDKDGDKKFMTGGKILGCFHKFGKLTKSKPLIICEGYATGASIHLATGLPVVVAFNSVNLKPVAQALREKHPQINLVIAADNDTENNHGNVGLVKANEAALLVNAKVVFPNFEIAA